MISETPTIFSRTRYTSTNNFESVRKGQSWIASECRPSNQNEELCGRQLRTMSMRLLILLGAASLCSCPTIATGQPVDGQFSGAESAIRQQGFGSQALSPATTARNARAIRAHSIPKRPHFYVMYE